MARVLRLRPSLTRFRRLTDETTSASDSGSIEIFGCVTLSLHSESKNP